MAATKDKRYIEAVGRRKTAVARVRITPASKTAYVVNEKALADYFDHIDLISTVESAIKEVEDDTKYSVSVKVNGGGTKTQSEAIRLGIARALIIVNPESRKVLKKIGFLKRDARIKERKKPGLRKARKAPQWSKR